MSLIFIQISITNDLIPILWYSEMPKLQCTTLSCINVIVKLCDRDERQSIIRIMNVKISRKTISETILNLETKLSSEMEKELHMYQTYILRYSRLFIYNKNTKNLFVMFSQYTYTKIDTFLKLKIAFIFIEKFAR